MNFKLLPMIDTMCDLYSKPRSMERFNEYISTLEGGTKGNMQLPISGFNPMAKEHVLEKLKELKDLDAEKIMEETIAQINSTLSDKNERTFQVVLNLADDLKGSWTNRYTTDFDSKFKLNALVSRNFCTPYFWTSENYSEELIKERTREYIYRTIYWLSHKKPITLKDHLEQEIFVAGNVGIKNGEDPLREKFYSEASATDIHNIIFNFFYGDEACKTLEYSTYGMSGEGTGFDFAKIMAAKKTNSTT